jgi:hypothetical protein
MSQSIRMERLCGLDSKSKVPKEAKVILIFKINNFFKGTLRNFLLHRIFLKFEG